jgi:hypothetical protein
MGFIFHCTSNMEGLKNVMQTMPKVTGVTDVLSSWYGPV